MGTYATVALLISGLTTFLTEKSTLSSDLIQDICSWIETNFSTTDKSIIPSELKEYIFAHARICKYEIVIKLPKYQFFTITKNNNNSFSVDEYKISTSSTINLT